MESEPQSIKCKKFCDAEAVIKRAEAKMKLVKSNKERQYYAQDTSLEAETLLSCANFNTGNPDCKSCHSILRNCIKEYEI